MCVTNLIIIYTTRCHREGHDNIQKTKNESLEVGAESCAGQFLNILTGHQKWDVIYVRKLNTSTTAKPNGVLLCCLAISLAATILIHVSIRKYEVGLNFKK